MKRTGRAHWKDGLNRGQGNLSTASGALRETPYSFRSRFEEEPQTNPEELLAAAHAGCFSMALAMTLEKAGITASRIDTEAQVILEEQADGFAITRIHLDVSAVIPGATADQFSAAANTAKNDCPVSKLFQAEITLEARLLDIG